MENNNNSITLASMEKREEWLIDIKENLKPQPECCIYQIPINLREINNKAYTPQVISIGPLHHGKEEFVNMEKQKIRYRREFSERFSRFSNETWKELITFVEDNEKRIRDCYEDTHKFKKQDFITMILYDAVFIIELFLGFHQQKTDFLLSKPLVTSFIRRDLQLLENQLPYFVIRNLYELAFPDHSFTATDCPPFLLLSYKFFYDHYMFNKMPEEEVEVKHFTDLIRHVITRKYPETKSEGCVVNLPCAVKLHQSGLKFKGIEKECMLNVRFDEKKKLGIPWFQVHELQISLIEISDNTECFIRNIMALEQCHYPSEAHVCNYIDLMDFLINTEEDVNFLVQAGIISNQVGDTAAIGQMFNKLGRQINLGHSCYNDIADKLKDYNANDWNRAKATLKRVYFSNPWRGTGTVAAIVLLALTLI